MKRRVAIKAAAAVSLASLAGCDFFPAAPEAPSKIVERVEREGAGDVRRESPQAITQWFAQRGTLAVEMNRMCAARTTVAGNTEARVCAAASATAFWQPGPQRAAATFKSFNAMTR